MYMSTTEVSAPLSSQQQLWCQAKASGAFDPRFIASLAVQITGPIDLAMLQAALDDVVARHEVLRTTLVCDAQSAHQRISPPSPVPLLVEDLPPIAPGSRDEFARQLVTSSERDGVRTDELPLLRADLVRFDDQESILNLVSHHTACDGWAMNLILRDLTAFYVARTGGEPLNLPAVQQYQDYVRWQRADDAGSKMKYWHEQLDGAAMFSLPADRSVRAPHTQPYVQQTFTIDTDVTAALTRYTKTERCSGFMVMLAAFYVLAHRIRGTLDPVVNTIVHGHGQRQFKDTVGPFLNFLALRTDLADCLSFRDLVSRTRTTCLDAYVHEVPIQQVQAAIPSLGQPLTDPLNCDFIFGYWDVSVTGARNKVAPLQIGQGARVLRDREGVNVQMPGGAAWNMALTPSGVLSGGLQYSPDEFDESTVAGWVSAYCQIVAKGLSDPDLDWQAL
jgi:hypothetical protein